MYNKLYNGGLAIRLIDKPEMKEKMPQWYVAVEDSRIIGGKAFLLPMRHRKRPNRQKTAFPHFYLLLWYCK